MEENGKESLVKLTSHLSINYFYVTELVGWNEVNIGYFPTDGMISNYMIKPLFGGKCKLLRDMIMNLSSKHHCIGQKECVGWNI